jgi:hypothetical protein
MRPLLPGKTDQNKLAQDVNRKKFDNQWSFFYKTFRTVVALNLPMDRPTIEGVAELFKACGDIVLVRILRPGNPIPADVRPFVNKHPEMAAKVCALVEFERTEFARKVSISSTFYIQIFRTNIVLAAFSTYM